MLKFALLFIAGTSVASAGVDERFADGALGLKWGARLEQVESVWSGGLAWPVEGKTRDGVVYVVKPRTRTLDVATSVKQVQFIFNKEDALISILFHFSYVDRDSVLYDIGEMLGHDYSVRDVETGRKYSWEPGKATVPGYRVGLSARQPWALFAIQSTQLR